MSRLIAAGGIASLLLLTGAVAAEAAPPDGKGCGSCIKSPVPGGVRLHARPGHHLRNPVTLPPRPRPR